MSYKCPVCGCDCSLEVLRKNKPPAPTIVVRCQCGHTISFRTKEKK